MFIREQEDNIHADVLADALFGMMTGEPSMYIDTELMKHNKYLQPILSQSMKLTMSETRELTHGEKAAGVTFNPSNNPTVDSVKSKFAIIIDELNDLRGAAASGEAKRYYSKAISYAEDAQMNAVKAVTWQY